MLREIFEGKILSFQGKTKIFRKFWSRGTIFSVNFGPRTKIFRTKNPVTDVHSYSYLIKSLWGLDLYSGVFNQS